jgi:23S rRNA (uracil1939-C5)-methyltransferase
MVDLVLDSLALQPEDTILDAYCGVGLFSAFIAPKVKKVIGVEQSESACEDYTQNLDAQENVELYVGSAEEILPHLAASPTGIVTDPPRAGLAKAALEAMVKMQPKRIVYVSCDPSTLARDARRLVEHGYELIRITPLDLFPQTYHIEAVCLFTKITR